MGVKSVKEFGGEREKKKENRENDRKESKSSRGEGREAAFRAVYSSKAVNTFTMISIPLLIYWAVHTEEQESNHTGAAEDSL